MKHKLSLLLLNVIVIFTTANTFAQNNLFNSVASLPATDALGRKLPTFQQTGGIRKDKFVGIFYWTWHTEQSSKELPFNTSELLKKNPQAIADYNNPIWPKQNYPFYWGEPLFGYYRDTDKWVLRKHAEMLADAGIDVIIFDCTNGNITWKESYQQLCKVFTQARKDGVKTPQIAFMLPFGVTDGGTQIINELYKELYQPGLYKDLWFYWKGKPLIMAYPELVTGPSTDSVQNSINRAIKDFFTFRPGQPTYNTGPARPDQWGWLEIYPQHGYVKNSENGYEEVTVGVAQNWSTERGLTAMNAPNAFGRSYTVLNGKHTEKDAVNYGFNFQEQWDNALKIDPEFIFITGWNEWIAGRYPLWQQQINAFPDEFNEEGSRDIEPMKGGHSDDYYYQMIGNIRYFKGMPAPDPVFARLKIKIDGEFNDWDSVKSMYRSYRGNTIHRNSQGWGPLRYLNNSGRNDIVLAKVSSDRRNVYFYVQTAEKLSKQTDKGWMRLFIDVDCNKATGWEGYDFVINRLSPGRKALLEKSTNGWNWKKVGYIEYKKGYKEMEISVPRVMLDIKKTINLEFKWSDNMQTDGDINDFLINGDVAPSGRFNYLYTVSN